MENMNNRQIRNPILLCCFSRGGSNILWNLVASHPHIVTPLCELHEPFRQKPLNAIMNVLTLKKYPSLTKPLPVIKETPYSFFAPGNLKKRPELSEKTLNCIEEEIYKRKFYTLKEPITNEIYPGVPYTEAKVHGARVCLKALDGIVFTSDPLRKKWPEMKNIVLYRCPEAVFESWKRRRKVGSAEEFISVYKPISEEMLSQEDTSLFVAFDELLRNPGKVLNNIGYWIGCDFSALAYVKLKAKGHYTDDGYWKPSNSDKHFWIHFDELNDYLNKNIDDTQLGKIGEKNRIKIEKELSPIKTEFKKRIKDCDFFGE